ncbi:MAG: competence/damage-inducible protein A, partial [Planctomycetota bacterium]
MRAEVIAIGDELTSGERLDTNSRWLSQRLVENGIPVLYHSTVGDDSAAC